MCCFKINVLHNILAMYRAMYVQCFIYTRILLSFTKKEYFLLLMVLTIHRRIVTRVSLIKTIHFGRSIGQLKY